MLSHSGFLVRMTGFDMHFRVAKIKVATSVCTGGRNCPPDNSIVMGSNPANKQIQLQITMRAICS